MVETVPQKPPDTAKEAVTADPPPRIRPPMAPIPPPPPPKSVAKGPGPGDMKDGMREVVETIVFVVVLVLLLKTFIAEAFVIPTGSMATTLLGYHREVTCDMCGYHFLVNSSSEAEDKTPNFVTRAYCPNCRYLNVVRPVAPQGEFP